VNREVFFRQNPNRKIRARTKDGGAGVVNAERKVIVGRGKRETISNPTDLGRKNSSSTGGQG